MPSGLFAKADASQDGEKGVNMLLQGHHLTCLRCMQLKASQSGVLTMLQLRHSADDSKRKRPDRASDSSPAYGACQKHASFSETPWS